MKRKKDGKGLLTIAVLTCIGILSVVNLELVKDPFTKCITKKESFSDFVEQVEKNYTSDKFIMKNYFINLNGLFARATGRRTLNEVVRCKNGILTQTCDKMNVGKLSESIIQLSEYLETNEDIPFLYIQFPYKEDLNGELFPEGIDSYANQNADDLLVSLESKKVRTLDLRPELSQTTEMLEQYFYRTDHHWNSDGAFVAFQRITAEMKKMFPNNNIDLNYTQDEKWSKHELANWFLGSRGKRVGCAFTGVDPLTWRTPCFETNMSCSIPKHSDLFCGDFANANIRTQYIEKRDYFDENAYCVYIGGDYPLVQHRNVNAPSNLRVLILKDSYMLPVQSFFSTIFQEVDVIDPRYFKECTVAEYINWTKPDVVLLGLNPDAFWGKAYKDFGVTKLTEEKTEGKYHVIQQNDIKVELGDNKKDNYNYTIVPLEANRTYRVSFNHIDVLDGNLDGVQVVLYDREKKDVISCRLFDFQYYENLGKYMWTFKTPETEDKLELLFYAGKWGSTAGTGVAYRNVVLEKYM